LIQDCANKKLLGIGKEQQSRYCLVIKPLTKVHSDLDYLLSTMPPSKCGSRALATDSNSNVTEYSYELWHKRLGHASLSQIKHIPSL